MAQKSIKQLVRELETKKRHLAKLRDKLRSLSCEINEYHDDTDMACQDLESAIDRHSKYV